MVLLIDNRGESGTNTSSSELVHTGELIQGWDEDFAAIWIEAMDEADLREKEIMAASRGANLRKWCRVLTVAKCAVVWVD